MTQCAICYPKYMLLLSSLRHVTNGRWAEFLSLDARDFCLHTQLLVRAVWLLHTTFMKIPSSTIIALLKLGQTRRERRKSEMKLAVFLPLFILHLTGILFIFETSGLPLTEIRLVTFEKDILFLELSKSEPFEREHCIGYRLSKGPFRAGRACARVSRDTENAYRSIPLRKAELDITLTHTSKLNCTCDPGVIRTIFCCWPWLLLSMYLDLFLHSYMVTF